MRILVLADEPVQRLWSEYGKETLREADLILSCGDLPSSYLSYITCFSSAPVVYVHGNHDLNYETKPPEGCINAEGHVVLVHGIRILGLGGSMRYRPEVPCTGALNASSLCSASTVPGSCSMAMFTRHIQAPASSGNGIGTGFPSSTPAAATPMSGRMNGR